MTDARKPSEKAARIGVFNRELFDEVRHFLLHVVAEMQDEGDRVYFGSTNDADHLKEIAQRMDAMKWEDVMNGYKP